MDRPDWENAPDTTGLHLKAEQPPKEKPRSGNAHCVTQAEEDVHGRRFVIVLQLADVRAINLCRKRKLLLG
jgi:hypothetical protein